MGLAHKTYNPINKTVLHPVLNSLQKRLVWLSAFCYLVLQGFVPAGYMPSFGLGSSSTPFVLCHGDNASAQWLNVQQNTKLDHAVIEQALSDQELVQNIMPSKNNSRHHPANLECGFSSFYLTQVLESFVRYNVVHDTCTFIEALPPQFFAIKKLLGQLRARAPPLLMTSDFV